MKLTKNTIRSVNKILEKETMSDTMQDAINEGKDAMLNDKDFLSWLEYFYGIKIEFKYPDYPDERKALLNWLKERYWDEYKEDFSEYE